MSKKVKIIIIATISVVVVGVGSVVGMNMVNKNKVEMGADQMQVELYTIPGKEKIFLNGKILPTKSESFNIDGEFGSLDKINVKDGQAVKKGALLYTLKNTENINQVSELKTQLANKQKELESAPDETIKAGINSEISDLNSQISSLNKKTYKSVYAPFEGKVYLPEQTQGAEGEMGPLMILETTTYFVKTEASEMEIVKLKKDQEIDIMVTATKEKAKGKISEIGDRPLDSSSASSDMNYNPSGVSFSSFPVEVSVENQKNLRNGFAVQVIAYHGIKENKVPVTSVLEEGGKYFVFKVVDDIAKKTEIKIKEKTEEHYLVTEGLSESDVLARDVNMPNIVDGQNIYGEGEPTK